MKERTRVSAGTQSVSKGIADNSQSSDQAALDRTPITPNKQVRTTADLIQDTAALTSETVALLLDVLKDAAGRTDTVVRVMLAKALLAPAATGSGKPKGGISIATATKSAEKIQRIMERIGSLTTSLEKNMAQSVTLVTSLANAIKDGESMAASVSEIAENDRDMRSQSGTDDGIA